MRLFFIILFVLIKEVTQEWRRPALVAVHPSESCSLPTQYLAPVSLLRINLYKVQTIYQTVHFPVGQDEISPSPVFYVESVNLLKSWVVSKFVCQHSWIWYVDTQGSGGSHSFKYESWPLPQLKKCVYWRNVKLRKCKLPKCSIKEM